MAVAALASLLITASPIAGHGEQETAGARRAAGSEQPSPAEIDEANALVREIAARAADWLAPPRVESLEYEFLDDATTTVKVTRGEPQSEELWKGATLQTGFQQLTKAPEHFDVQVTREPGAKTITIHARPKDEKSPIGLMIGHGLKDRFSNYASRSAVETTLVVDAERLTPREERTGSTSIYYSDWHESSAGRRVPGRLDVFYSTHHSRFHFDWLGDAVWLLRDSELIKPDVTTTMTRTHNVRIDGQVVTPPTTAAEARSRQAASELLAMLDHNRPWLDGGPTGAGWRTPFETLSYTFHAVREGRFPFRTGREDVRENCVLSRDGESLFELAHDDLDKTKNRPDGWRIALATKETATSQRDAHFAHIQHRPTHEQDRSHDLALKRYARIGCQLDLPLFQYRDRLPFATVSIEDGQWAGQPCRLASVSNLGRGVHFSSGTMLGVYSWLHQLREVPSRELIYIDSARNVPVHETFVSTWDSQTFEIDFGDYVEVEPGQWAPRTIRIESPKTRYTCEYRFQLVAGTHWLLAEVVSGYHPTDKSRGVVEDVRPEGGRERLEAAHRRLAASRTLFNGDGEPVQSVEVSTVPLPLGRTVQCGPYEVGVTVKDAKTILVTATTDDPDAPDVLPLAFLDAKQRLLFSTTVTLERRNGSKHGSTSLRSSSAWKSVRSMTVPGGAGKPVKVVPIRWGEPIAVNIRDAGVWEVPNYRPEEPRESPTRAWRIRLDRTDDGAAKATLDLVSVQGGVEFQLDVAVALLSESGEVVSCGGLATDLKVDALPTEARYEIKLSPLRNGVEPKSMLVGFASGGMVSMSLGSFWASGMLDESSFDVDALLAAPDETCRRVGLDELNDRTLSQILKEEFFDDRSDDRRHGDGPLSRRTQMKPYREVLIQLVENGATADVKAQAARLLAYSEADGATATLEKLRKAPDAEVRDAVDVGLVFLGRSEPIGSVRTILGRTPDQTTGGRDVFSRNEQDALVALVRHRSDAAVDVLGETLLATLDALRPEIDPKSTLDLQRRSARATAIASLLRRTDNPRAVRWLTSALDFMERQPDATRHVDRSELASSMVRFLPQTKDRIAAELETGRAPGVWAKSLGGRSGDFVPPIRAMLRREDLAPDDAAAGISYLVNCNAPEAVDSLRELYDRSAFRANAHLWLTLCAALAERGDGRGAADAYRARVELEPPGAPPKEERAAKAWRESREKRREVAEAVLYQAPKNQLEEFLRQRTEPDSRGELRILLRLLWTLPELPEPFTHAVSRWARDDDPKIAHSAGRLLARD